MSIVVNDFEVIAEAAPAAAASGSPQSGAAQPRPSGPRPLDLRDTLAHQARRAERVRAH